MKNIYKFLVVVIICCGWMAAQGQTRVITGTVSNESETLPGISVTEKGVPANAVSTAADGKFRITLRGTSNILVVSGLGYISQEVSVSGTANVNVRLETDQKMLDDVVIIGYGTQTKLTLTGSVSSVNRTEIQQAPSASLQNALTGKVSGYFSQQRSGRPGDDAADFYVRGVSTFTGNQSPLVLVDDIEFSYSDFSNIDPNEVQSITVLKDAATTAPYGVKGANGVILVTTRRGGISAPTISFRSEYGLQVPTHIPEFLEAGDVAMLRNEALKNDATISGATYAPEFTDTDIELYRNGQDPYGHPNVNWYNTLFKKAAPTAKLSLDVSGGTEAVQYFISLGYQTQGGISREFHVENDVNTNFMFNRYNFRSNLDIKASRSLNFKFDFSGNNTLTNSPSNSTGAFFDVYNYEELTPFVYPIYNPDGSYGFASPARAAPSNNIVGIMALGGYSRARQNQLNLNVSAIQKLDVITKGLQASIVVAVSNGTSSTRTQTRSNFPSFYYDPVAKTYTPRNTNIYRIDPYSLGYSAGSPSRQTTINASVNYVRKFGRNNLAASLRANQSSRLSGASLPENLRGLGSRISYDYNNKYLLEFNAGYNGTDKFAALKRYGLFPAVSAGWVVSGENFMKKHAKFMDLLKFRGSYGITGSDNLPNGIDNSYQESYNASTNAAGSYSFGETHTSFGSIIPGTIGNDDVSWEKERKANIGMDFSMFNGKLSGSVDVFDNRRYDILANRQTIASYFGVPDGNLPPENLGIVTNNGYEFELGYKGKIGKDFGYSFKTNYSFAENKIVEIDEVPQKYAWKTQTGQSIGAIQVWLWDGYYSVAEAKDPTVPKYAGSTTAAGGPGTTLPGFLKYRDLNGDGVISSDDQGYFGKPNLPNTNIGLNTGLTYKRVTFNISLQSALNSEVQVGYNLSVPFKANLRAIHLQRWTPETAETAEFPSLVSNFHGTYMTTGNSDYWAISGNYLRIKSLELGYRLPDQWISRIGLKNARAYVNAYNLKTWSVTFKELGLDPEVARNAGGGVYPVSAIFNVGFNVSLK